LFFFRKNTKGLGVDFLIVGSVAEIMGQKKNGPQYRDPFTLEMRYNNTIWRYEKGDHLYHRPMLCLSIDGLSSDIILRIGHCPL
jgi:hypothetical protein